MIEFRIKNLELRIKVFWLWFFIALFFILYSLFSYQPTLAQTAGCLTQSSPLFRVFNGLISAYDINNGQNDKFGSDTGSCIIGNPALFAPYKIPAYADLKSLYYIQAKTSTSVVRHNPLTGNKTQNDIPLTSGNDHLYYVTGDLSITSNIPGNQTGVVFVDGKLNIGPLPSDRLIIGANVGLVFVVQGDVSIDQSVTEIDAVIVSAGTIYTAGAGCSHTLPVVVRTGSGMLDVTGSLISLDPGKTIEFCRSFADNSSIPAERIEYQPKYLVILRNLMSDTLQKWSEIQ